MQSTQELYGYPESDWKVFGELREVALERFCESVFDGIEAFRQDTRLSHHARYLALFRWPGERNQELPLAFDERQALPDAQSADRDSST